MEVLLSTEIFWSRIPSLDSEHFSRNFTIGSWPCIVRSCHDSARWSRQKPLSPNKLATLPNSRLANARLKALTRFDAICSGSRMIVLDGTGKRATGMLTEPGTPRMCEGMFCWISGVAIVERLRKKSRNFQQ